MGNMLPSLFQARNNTVHWSRSMKLVTRILGRTMKRPCRVSMAQTMAAASRPETLAVHHATSRTRRAQKNGGHRRSRRVVRVKVVLTRAEAARLLSLTEHGDRTAAQIVSEFRRMQVAHANNGAPAAAKAWRPVLESIPEELP